jgi:hypothetical protein
MPLRWKRKTFSRPIYRVCDGHLMVNQANKTNHRTNKIFFAGLLICVVGFEVTPDFWATDLCFLSVIKH